MWPNKHRIKTQLKVIKRQKENYCCRLLSQYFENKKAHHEKTLKLENYKFSKKKEVHKNACHLKIIKNLKQTGTSNDGGVA